MANTLGKYELISELGAGAFGAVYRARDGVLGREAALKVLKPALIADATTYDRYVCEVQTVVNLEHLNIATLNDTDQADEEGTND